MGLPLWALYWKVVNLSVKKEKKTKMIRVSHNRLPGCPGQPFLSVGQPKADPWLPDRATKSSTICLYIYVVGQPQCLVGQPQFDTGCPTGQPVFKTNVKP